jgi:hypothetical protein
MTGRQRPLGLFDKILVQSPAAYHTIHKKCSNHWHCAEEYAYIWSCKVGGLYRRNTPPSRFSQVDKEFQRYSPSFQTYLLSSASWSGATLSSLSPYNRRYIPQANQLFHRRHTPNPNHRMLDHYSQLRSDFAPDQSWKQKRTPTFLQPPISS